MTKQFILKREILARSVSDNWQDAALEWKLYGTREVTEARTCLCTHTPIFKVCVLKNELNGNTASVGNCCVKKFLGLPSNLIFQAIKRVRSDVSSALNKESINFAYSRHFISDWDREFYLDTLSKRTFTEKQLIQRRRINQKFLHAIDKISTDE